MDNFADELTSLINKYSEENRSNTPDWILAWYMRACLDAFNRAVDQREQWFGRKTSEGCVLLPIEPLEPYGEDLVDVVGTGEERDGNK